MVFKPGTTGFGLRVRWVDYSVTLPSSHNVGTAKLSYSLIKKSETRVGRAGGSKGWI